MRLLGAAWAILASEVRPGRCLEPVSGASWSRYRAALCRLWRALGGFGVVQVFSWRDFAGLESDFPYEIDPGGGPSFRISVKSQIWSDFVKNQSQNVINQLSSLWKAVAF